MKKLLTFFFLSISILSFAQDVTDNSTPIDFEGQLESLFENVDLTEVDNFMWEQMAFPWIELENFKGELNSKNYTTCNTFGLLYAKLYDMALDDVHRLPKPNDYRELMDNKDGSDVIPLAVLDFG